MLECILAALFGGTIGGIGIALFAGQKVARLEAENKFLRASLTDWKIGKDKGSAANSNTDMER